MALSTADICPFGWKARDFALKGVDGKTYSLADVRGPKGTLVVFICNHCPYVKASISRIVAEANALRQIGIGTIAIMPNDTEAYPEDSFDNMRAFAAHHGFSLIFAKQKWLILARSVSVHQPLRLCRCQVQNDDDWICQSKHRRTDA
ncbi:MAG: redoxin domain-containing protein [Xanthobacteraceae bacterium]